MKTLKSILFLCLFIGIPVMQLVAQNGVETERIEMWNAFELPVNCSGEEDILKCVPPWYGLCTIGEDKDGDLWFITHWKYVEFQLLGTGETFIVRNAASERFREGEVYDIKLMAKGSEGSKIIMHLKGYGQWNPPWEIKLCKCL